MVVKRTRKIVLFMTALLVSSTAMAVYGAPVPTPTKGSRLELKQLHRLYGQTTVEITKDGVRVSSPSTDYAFLCKAPDWDEVLYSDKRKLVARKSFADWSKKGIRTALSVMDNEALYDWPRTLVIKKKYKGLDAALYAFPYRYENGYPAPLKFGKFGEYMLSTGFPVHKKIQMFLQALYDTPPAEGLPLKMTKFGESNSFGMGLKYNKTEDSIQILDTLKATWDNRPGNFSTAQLKTYKTVPESSIVVIGDDFGDVFDNLMSDKEKKGSVKKTESK